MKNFIYYFFALFITLISTAASSNQLEWVECHTSGAKDVFSVSDISKFHYNEDGVSYDLVDKEQGARILKGESTIIIATESKTEEGIILPTNFNRNGRDYRHRQLIVIDDDISLDSVREIWKAMITISIFGPRSMCELKVTGGILGITSGGKYIIRPTLVQCLYSNRG